MGLALGSLLSYAIYSFFLGRFSWKLTINHQNFQAKDCVQLLHLWLAKRELESRRVKDRDFKGVDIRELDLLPSFLQREGL